MTTRTVEQVDDWDARPFSGGYAGLRDLSDERFSGIVTAGPTRLCMTKGTVVGVLDGRIEDFAEASGTAHEAPSPALPLLAVMQDRTDEVRAQYYTEDTPLADVDGTLQDGNFTGYVELSENVLSGDYYLVYHQGRRMSVAFVGASGQLLTDDEAFDTAADEVGIYEVRPVEVDAIEVPEPAGGAAESADEATESAGATSSVGGSEESTEPAAETESAGTSAGAAIDAATDAAESDEPDDPEEPAVTDVEAPSVAETSSDVETPSEVETPPGAETAATDRAAGGSGSASGRDRGEGGSARGDGSASARGTGGESGAARVQATGGRAGGARDSRGGSATDVGELETRSIPSLDPARSSEPRGESPSGPVVETPSEVTPAESA
ncbi:MAG: hypothetical protein ABEJ31_05175, partial [Haloarculaceae archaeon]